MNAVDQVSPFDRREMMMLHNMFRREFALMPQLVRDVCAGDRVRAYVVYDHIVGVRDVLHHHHAGEDELIWPLLLDRCAADVAPLVQLMEAQHGHLAGVIRQVDGALVQWCEGPAVHSRDALASALDRLVGTLREHLDAEEDHALPLIEAHITAAEWDEAVRQGSVDADPDHLPLGFGMLMYEAHPDVVEHGIANMPVDARPIIKVLAADAFATHSQRVHGTTTPPRSTELPERTNHA